jgi:hypothetical protein
MVLGSGIVVTAVVAMTLRPLRPRGIETAEVGG